MTGKTPGTRPRVAVASSPPIVATLESWRRQECPAELLFGVDVMIRHGLQVVPVEWAGDPVEWRPRGFLRGINRLTKGAAGVVPFEHAILRQSAKADVLYCGQLGLIGGLATLRQARAIKKPIVAVAQPRHWAGTDRSVRAVDAVICISRKTQRTLETAARGQTHIVYLPWGPDLDFAGYRLSSEGEGVLSTGKTDRDLPTLIEAATSVHFRVTVHDVRRVLPAALPRNVAVSQRSGFLPILDEVASAAAVAIPLPAAPDGTSGITELNVAMAMGKPVIMTRNDYIDIDVDRIGMGWQIDAGDVRGWARALHEVEQDPVAAAEMGQRGRQWAETHWNARLFGDGVVDVILHASC